MIKQLILVMEQKIHPSNKYYPNIFKEELTGSVDGKYGSTLGLSDQTEYVTGYSGTTTLKGKLTAYSYTMSTSYMDSTYVNIFTDSNGYWLASRCVTFTSKYAFFQMFYVSHSKIGCKPFCSTRIVTIASIPLGCAPLLKST